MFAAVAVSHQLLLVLETIGASAPEHSLEYALSGRIDRCGSCRALEHRHAVPTHLLAYLIAPETQTWTKHRNRFECDMYCHEGGLKLPNHSRIRRKGVGWDSEALRGAELSTPGMSLIAVLVTQKRTGEMKFGGHLVQRLRRVQEERQMDNRRMMWNYVLIPNRPGIRTGWILVTAQRSHPLMAEANHLDWLSEALPVFGIG
jgi:hypothetical protein